MIIIGSLKVLRVALLSAALITPQTASASSEFDFGQWAQNKIDTLKEEAIEGTNNFNNVTSSIADELSKASEKAGNITSDFAGDLADNGKRAAFAGVMVYLGECPKFYKEIPKIPAVVAPKLAETFQAHSEDPSQDKAFCVHAAKEGISKAISEDMTTSTEQEKTAVQWIARDHAAVVCNDALMATLTKMECIRMEHPPQYEEAVKLRLLLDVLTEDSLRAELDKICGEHSSGFRLYLDHGVVTARGPEPASQSAQRLLLPGLTALFGVGIVVAATTAIMAARRAVHRHGAYHRAGVEDEEEALGGEVEGAEESASRSLLLAAEPGAKL
mmetsp:Transcript_120560/g.257459  ORF Transcript_120560/g.257459 Transcript_120560/m.257459 type:complete len:329 (+) Transcript_120560:58-1044(+)